MILNTNVVVAAATFIWCWLFLVIETTTRRNSMLLSNLMSQLLHPSIDFVRQSLSTRDNPVTGPSFIDDGTVRQEICSIGRVVCVTAVVVVAVVRHNIRFCDQLGLQIG